MIGHLTSKLASSSKIEAFYDSYTEWTGPHIATVQEVFSPALHGRLERSNLTNQIKVSVNMWEYPKENSPR